MAVLHKSHPQYDLTVTDVADCITTTTHNTALFEMMLLPWMLAKRVDQGMENQTLLEILK